MKKILTYIFAIAMVFAFCANAQVTPKPRLETKPADISTPHHKPHHKSHYMFVPKNKIYTPDRYSCNIRRKLKYCVDRRGKALNGTVVQTNGNSVVYETYLNGYQNGETSVYSAGGTLLERAVYKKGLRHGEAVEYYLNGNVWLIKHYEKGMLEGKVEEYDISGVMVGQMTYKKGWLKEAFCANEKPGYSMAERMKNTGFNQIISCSNNDSPELM